MAYNKPIFVVQDPNETVLGETASYYDSSLVWSLSTNFAVLTFTLPANDPTSGLMVNNNYITFVYQNKTWRFQIVTMSIGDDGSFTITANALALQLTNGQLNPANAPDDAQQMSYYVSQALANTGWTIGRDEIGNSLVKKISFSDTTTPIARMYSIADLFNAELDFRLELDDHYHVLNKYVDLVNSLGTERHDVMLGWGENVTSIDRTIDTSSLATALIATGAGGINLTSMDYTSADGRYKSPAGVSYMMDTVANQHLNNGAGYIISAYQDDTATSQQQLATDTIAQLQSVSTPQVTFDTKLAYLPEDIMIGDTLYLISNDPANVVRDTTRVVELDLCLDNPSKTSAKFGDYKTIDENGSTADLTQLKQQIAAAQSTANEANTNAANAQTAANNANATANSANSTANTANTNAANAQAAANNADTAAKDALSAASKAQTMLPIISTTAPSNPQEGQIWFEGVSSAQIKVIHQYTGGSWVIAKVNPTALNVSALSALSANLGTVTAGSLSAVSITGSDISNVTSSTDNDGYPITTTQTQNADGYSIVTDRWYNGNEIIQRTDITSLGLFKMMWNYKSSYNSDTPYNGAQANAIIDPVNSSLSFYTPNLGDNYLNIQDAVYHIGGQYSCAWPTGMSAYNNNFSLVRKGQFIFFSAYIHTAGTVSSGSYLVSLPSWALPVNNIVVPATTVNSSVGGASSANLLLNTGGFLSINSGTVYSIGYLSVSCSFMATDVTDFMND
ncbi:phage tail spike protein [Schleiferilactobacillus harbinensis]|uniref:phage tail spike protein n=1 Tax=Schleiferilactobacillus harbinensis TaxID=304207 RepID=UPI0039EA3C87